jgi:sulfate transport system substrate-binding protein
MKQIRVSLVALAAVSAFTLTMSATASRRDISLTLVSYSTPREAYGKIISAFQKTPAGKDVKFTQSYGASGEQSRAIENGLKADLFASSLAPDISRLVKAGLVSKGWNRGPTKGMVTNSVVVFAVRDGNPKKIRQWRDLIKPGVEVLSPNPFTSGGAMWNVMAAYGAQRKDGKTHKAAVDYLLKLFQHIEVQDKSAREALQTFLGGKGDVVLAYENEALLAQKNNQDLQFVIPRNTILIENPVVALRKSENQAAARAFLNFLRGPQAQQIYGENGYRPVLKSAAAKFRYPRRPGLFTIDAEWIGGWDRVLKRFFDPKSGIVADIERKVGGVTG